jgi:hypothetical protein
LFSLFDNEEKIKNFETIKQEVIEKLLSHDQNISAVANFDMAISRLYRKLNQFSNVKKRYLPFSLK